MASGDTKLSICSDALIMLGESPLTSFSGTDAGVVCDRLYDDIKKMTLAMYPWSFTISKLQLSRGTAPVNEYKYAYNFQQACSASQAYVQCLTRRKLAHNQYKVAGKY